MVSPCPLLHPHQHDLGDRQDGEGDEEQDQTQRYQRRYVQLAHGLVELVGDRRRDRRPRSHQRLAYPVGVADDERDGHGLAQRAAEAEHDAADDADAGIGQHHLPDDFPGRGAQPIGGFLDHRRHRLEHVAHDRGDEGQHHDPEDQACGEDADAVGRPGEDVADQGSWPTVSIRKGWSVCWKIGAKTNRPQMP